MRGPFRLQASEYDCVPTCFLNALVYLFKRNEIPAEAVQKIYTWSLDAFSERGLPCRGTTINATHAVAGWLAGITFGKKGSQRSVEFTEMEEDDVRLGATSKIEKCLQRGGVALLRVTHGKESHFILLLQASQNSVLAFDPYPIKSTSGYTFVENFGPTDHNLEISKKWLEGKQGKNDKLRMGPVSSRSCLLVERVT